MLILAHMGGAPPPLSMERSALSRLMQRQVLMKRRILALLLVAIQSRGFGDFDP
jgi:hypothetical protein